jgi:dihydroorotate dehydrogenase electron transfer subunit
MIQTQSRIVSSEQVNPSCWRIVFDSPQIASELKPGQFIHMKVGGEGGPLFRRPFSVFRRVPLKDGGLGIEVVYKVVGLGTGIMTRLKPGDTVDMIGPLGRGFTVDREKRDQVIVAGGTGAACLFLLAQEISNTGLPLKVLMGADTKNSLIMEREYASLQADVMISTDDGTYGYHGFVTKLFEKALEEGKISTDCAAYSSGPEPMLKALARICKTRKVTAQFSIERHMMCGFGACLACICKVDPNQVSKHRDLERSHIQFSSDKNFGYALVCKDGPVFNMDEVIFDE